MNRWVLVLSAVFACVFQPAGGAQVPSRADRPDRALRFDVPMTDSIRRAHEAGTRGPDGRPGPNYWQLRTDYTIEARLDTQTQTITGRETIEMHNAGAEEMTQIVLRLDHNVFRATVPRGSSVPAETTDGMVVTRLTVNGELVDLDPPPMPRRRG